MGSSSSRVSEDGGRRRRSRELGVFSSSCFGFHLSASDEQAAARHTRSKGIAFRPDDTGHGSSRELPVHQCAETSTMNTEVDQNRDAKTCMQQKDSGCINSIGQPLIDQSSNHSCCLYRPHTFMPERDGFGICKALVARSSENNVSSTQDNPLSCRTEYLENAMLENNHDYDRRRVPLEGSIRFSRTRSVGRLRDRVIRRNALYDDLFGALVMEERSLIRSNSQVFSRQTIGRTSTFTQTNETPMHCSYVDGSTPSSLLHNSETSQIRDAGNHDLFEHRSVFLERRRRIRSQVRALQRLGSRFENLSGHNRSCILSGQYQTGQCTCRSSDRHPNSSNNGRNSRTSISRIVMLAEALFEVLDEIHQQSAVLSSRQSSSSLGSVPAPIEIVDNIPMKVYGKSKRPVNQDVPQCYICLVEYEDGESIRTLPCQHEFHKTCVDKWLKEVHGVCPVCRGNVCK